MEEQEMIDLYKTKEKEFDNIRRIVETYFFEKARTFLKNGDRSSAMKLIDICPDHVTNVFIIDAVQNNNIKDDFFTKEGLKNLLT